MTRARNQFHPAGEKFSSLIAAILQADGRSELACHLQQPDPPCARRENQCQRSSLDPFDIPHSAASRRLSFAIVLDLPADVLAVHY